jgi:hypothetical protein
MVVILVAIRGVIRMGMVIRTITRVLVGAAMERLAAIHTRVRPLVLCWEGGASVGSVMLIPGKVVGVIRSSVLRVRMTVMTEMGMSRRVGITPVVGVRRRAVRRAGAARCWVVRVIKSMSAVVSVGPNLVRPMPIPGRVRLPAGPNGAAAEGGTAPEPG